MTANTKGEAHKGGTIKDPGRRLPVQPLFTATTAAVSHLVLRFRV